MLSGTPLYIPRDPERGSQWLVHTGPGSSPVTLRAQARRRGPAGGAGTAAVGRALCSQPHFSQSELEALWLHPPGSACLRLGARDRQEVPITLTQRSALPV